MNIIFAYENRNLIDLIHHAYYNIKNVDVVMTTREGVFLSINLCNTQLFRGINESDLRAMMTCLSPWERCYRKGETIIAEGVETDAVGVVLSGRVIIEHSDLWGTNSILGNVDPGGVFAETYACIPGETTLIHVTAAEDSRVLYLNVGKILTTCSNACVFHARLIKNLLSVCAIKSLQLSSRIIHTTSKSIRGRLLSYLSDMAKKSGSLSFNIPFNRQQLADYLGVDRSTMCNELSKMQKEGMIRYERNSFVIKADSVI